MDTTTISMNQLFAQLGLPDDDEGIRAFIKAHRPLPMTVRLPDAPFWTPAQAALIQQKLADDGEWAVMIDTLNVQLRSHPMPADMPQGAG
ncbi:MAG: hypothetical protein CFE45_31615 [Burkholderiales bacterium PBB5]|nr:MAG: hypothetical protein CFE45_31615 [Burkholderiales bacterium PBB5]